MASPQQFDDLSPSDHDDSPPRVLRLRLIPWDVFSLLALLMLLAAIAFGTDWYSRLFGFLKDVCTGDCPPAPLGVDSYIYPVVWGCIGAAGRRGTAWAAGLAVEGLVSVLLATFRRSPWCCSPRRPARR